MKWDLTKIYENDEQFEKGLESINCFIEKLKASKGKLGNEDVFVDYFKTQIELTKTGYIPYIYAECKIDLDRRNTEAVNQMQKVMFTLQKLDEALSFEQSELLSLGSNYVLGVVNKHPELEELRFSFENLFRKKEHILSEDKQIILSNYSPLENEGSELYSALINGDSKKAYYTNPEGEKVEVTASNWSDLVKHAKDAEERKAIFEARYQNYKDHANTIAEIYKTVLEADNARAKSTGFGSSVEMYLFQNNIPLSLYHNLIEIAHKASTNVKKYIALRKKVLGLDEYHTYDRFLDLAKGDDKKYSYEEAKALFFDSIKGFTPEFQEYAREVLKDGYVDVLPKEGKRSGAYSNHVPGVHPIILLNFNGGLSDCFTLAHESGHSIHSLYSLNYQPVSTSSYTIFVAEIASTFNEHNLLDYMLKKDDLSKENKIVLVQNALDDIISTFIRQTLFGEYELKAHELIEKGLPITEDSLSKIMIDLYDQYYGIDITKEEVKKYIWAYIPHLFNSPYYVYQYATSFAASLAIYQNVKEQGLEAFEQYTSLLKSGGSNYPIELVKLAGVDFTKADCLEAVNKRFSDLISQLEKLID